MTVDSGFPWRRDRCSLQFLYTRVLGVAYSRDLVYRALSSSKIIVDFSLSIFCTVLINSKNSKYMRQIAMKIGEDLKRRRKIIQGGETPVRAMHSVSGSSTFQYQRQMGTLPL